MMTLQEIGAAVAKLLSRADGDMKAEVESIKATVEGALTEAKAEIVRLNAHALSVAADRDASKLTIGELETKCKASECDLEATRSSLDKAVLAIGLTVDAKAPDSDKITALQTAVSANMAKMNVKAGDIPAGSPRNGVAGTAEVKTVTRAEFDAMTPEQRNAHFRTGGKIKD